MLSDGQKSPCASYQFIFPDLGKHLKQSKICMYNQACNLYFYFACGDISLAMGTLASESAGTDSPALSAYAFRHDRD
jgi:hypothetical protein